ncbi:hypothetical protein [Butyrivibrio proteoclasticus]|uniref:hypothetical protein n=1 Tax=Butyrivibrio proteoclasticus TaxID=43305 RepID=UPI00047CB5AE|nr:hypothetical protein [Butyrivibrio proteoclasticus]
MRNKKLWKGSLAKGLAAIMVSALLAGSFGGITTYAEGEGDGEPVVEEYKEKPSEPAKDPETPSVEPEYKEHPSDDPDTPPEKPKPEDPEDPEIPPTKPTGDDPITTDPAFSDPEDPDKPDVPTPGEDDPKPDPEPEYDSDITEERDVHYDETLDDGTHTADVYVTITEKQYYSDKDSKDEDGNQTDDYQRVNKSDVQGQTLDYTDAYVEREGWTSHIYLEDENGDVVTVKNDKNEDVRLELPEDFDVEEDIEVVPRIPMEDGSFELLFDIVEAKDIFYGYFDDFGQFVECKPSDDKAIAYVNTKEGMKPTDTVYYTVGSKGEVYCLEEEVYKALKNESDTLTAKKAYVYNGKGYSREEMEEMEGISQVEDWSYWIEGREEVIATEQTHIYNTKGDESSGEGYADYKALWFEVIGERVLDSDGCDSYKAKIYIEYEGEVYMYIGKVGAYDDGRYSGIASEYNHWQIGDIVEYSAGRTQYISTQYYDLYKVEVVGQEEEESDRVIVIVCDPDGNMVAKFDKTLFENIQTGNITQINEDKVAVKDVDGNTVIIDAKDYHKYEEWVYTYRYIEKHNYTVQDKYQDRNVPITLDGNDYNLTVKFWQNARVGISGVEVEEFEDGTADVTVYYRFLDYDYNDPIVTDMNIVVTVSADNFGPTNEAILKLSALPHYYAEMQEYCKVAVMKKLSTDSLKAFLALELSDIHEIDLLEDEYWPEFPEEDGLMHWAEIDDPVYSLEKVVPQSNPDGPTPGPNNPSTPSTSVVATATPAQAVLGAVREDTPADQRAVLGAVRAGSTDDTTMSTLYRIVILMVAAFGAIFFVAKKKEN